MAQAWRTWTGAYPDAALFGEFTLPYRSGLHNQLFLEEADWWSTGTQLDIPDHIYREAMHRARLMNILKAEQRGADFDSLLGNDHLVWPRYYGPGGKYYQTNFPQGMDTFPLGVGMPGNLDGQKGLFMGGAGVQTNSPLILDLDGDGVETISVWNGTEFDHEGDRFAERTGWVSPDDALLVRDLNGNGQIDEGNELFGNNTLLNNGKKAANGFEALKELDVNGDGKIDSSDTGWNTLRLWQDKNANGKVDPGELLTLEEAGVKSPDVTYQNHEFHESMDENNNLHRQTGSYTKEDGTTGDMTDVWFVTDPPYRTDLDHIDLPEEYDALPDVKGYGKVYDLRQAMYRDESGVLRSIVEQFATEQSPDERRKLAIQIALHWTGTALLPTEHCGITGMANLNDRIDVRLLRGLANFYGYDTPWMVIRPESEHYYQKAVDSFIDYIEATLNAQTHCSGFADMAMSIIMVSKVLLEPLDVTGLVDALRIAFDSGNSSSINNVKSFLSGFSSCGDHPDELMKAIRDQYRSYVPSKERLNGELTFEELLSIAGLGRVYEISIFLSIITMIPSLSIAM